MRSACSAMAMACSESLGAVRKNRRAVGQVVEGERRRRRRAREDARPPSAAGTVARAMVDDAGPITASTSCSISVAIASRAVLGLSPSSTLPIDLDLAPSTPPAALIASLAASAALISGCADRRAVAGLGQQHADPQHAVVDAARTAVVVVAAADAGWRRGRPVVGARRRARRRAAATTTRSPSALPLHQDRGAAGALPCTDGSRLARPRSSPAVTPSSPTVARRSRAVPGALGRDRRAARRPVGRGRRPASRRAGASRRWRSSPSAATGAASWRRTATSTWCSSTTASRTASRRRRRRCGTRCGTPA